MSNKHLIPLAGGDHLQHNQASIGGVVHARDYSSQNREMLQMVLTRNLAIFLLAIELFYGATEKPCGVNSI